MFKSLNLGAIGIRGVTLPEAVQLAKRSGFAGLDFSIQEAAALAQAHGVAYVRGLFAAAGIAPGQWGLPVVRLRLWDEAQWKQDLQQLPALAALACQLGCTRTTTSCPSSTDEPDYSRYFYWVVDRYRTVATILKEHGCRLGIEFIGPKKSRARNKYEFIYTLDGVMDLAAAIGTGNVGVLLDAWHLYTSGGSVDDLAGITAGDVVVVHVNDAPAGVPLEQQDDHVRALPTATGVIDLRGFMRRLRQMGYGGPVTPEPFDQRLNALAGEDPLRATVLVREHMDRLWALSGLA